jgi:YVTN family beta-propeller protein
MSRARIYIFILLIFAFACTPRVSHYRAPLENEGELLIYLQPLPQGAENLRFAFEGLSAVRHDGSEYPLTQSLREVQGRDLLGMQNLLASGAVPPGAHSGISIKIKEAFLAGEEGEGELLVPEEPITVEMEFSLARRQALVLFLRFDPSRSVIDGFSFTPAFTLETPVSAPVNLTGYVTDPDSNTITIFNKKTQWIVGAIATGRGPKGIVLDRRRKRAYVALSGSGTVEIVDIFANVVTGRITLSPGDEPGGLALTPDGRTLVSANYGSGTVSIIDTNSRIAIGRVRVGEGPTDVAIDPQGSRAYVVNSLSETLSVIDLPRRRLQGSISVGPTPLQISFNRSGDRLYVTSRYSPDLFAVDTKTLSVTERIFVGTGTVSVEVDRKTDLILVGNALTGEISILEPSSSTAVDSIAVGGTPSFMTIDNEERVLFVAVPESRKVLKVNLVSNNLLSEMTVNGGIFEVAVMGGN